jgi:hypothetical protein
VPPAGTAPPAGEPAPGGEAPAPTPHAEPALRHAAAGCGLTLESASPSPVAAGETVHLDGRLSCPLASEGEGRTVTIVQREHGERRRETFTVTTGEEGRFTLEPVLDADSVFLARSPGARRARLTLEASDAVTLAGPAAAALATRGPSGSADKRIAFTGTVAPAIAGARVTLQCRYAAGEPWRTVKYARTGGEGGFSFSRAFRRSGQLSVRAVLHLGGRHRVYSPVLSYVLGQAQNPALTIASGSDPLPAGSSTTISGVLGAGAGQTVELLARTPGSGWTQLGSAQSGAGGTYSFEVAPTLDTIYRVRSGRQRSTALLLGVMPLLTLQPPPASAVTGTPVAIEGTVAGAPAGTPVKLERELPEGRLVEVARTSSSADGSFALSITFNQAGSCTLRILVSPQTGTVGAEGEPLTVAVSPA